MSVHSEYYGAFAAPMLLHQLGDRNAITYFPPGERDPIELDAIVGREFSLDEQDTGGIQSTRWIHVQVPTKVLMDHGITKVEAYAQVRLGDEMYAVDLRESSYGRHFVDLYLMAKEQQRQTQFRRSLR